MSRCCRFARPPALRPVAPPPDRPLSLRYRRPLSTPATPDPATPDTAPADTPPPPPPPSDGWSKFANTSASTRAFETSPDTAVRPWAESRLLRAGTPPVGSRRRRVALRTRANIPFEQLPFQCFQEARKILAEDRVDKLARIADIRGRIALAEVEDPPNAPRRIADMRRRVEILKLMADINDPAVKRRFEDGEGDMDKPIYRFLADRRWRAYHRLITVQRIKQFHIVPDLLPALEPIADVQLYRRRRRVEPGTVLDSIITERPLTLHVSVFDAGPRLLTVLVIDLDVPDPAADSFTARLHFAAVNIPWSPTDESLALRAVRREHIAVPWMPPFSQMGSPYHRMAVLVCRQPDGDDINAERVAGMYAGSREGFRFDTFRYRVGGLEPIGFTMFRTVWDEHTPAVMARASIPGADYQFRHMRIASLKPPKRLRGWEARRQGPKYRHVWKYTKRIRGLSNARRWTSLR